MIYCFHTQLLLINWVTSETLYCTLCTVHSVLYTVHTVLYTLYCTLCTVHCTHCTVHSAGEPYTLSEVCEPWQEKWRPEVRVECSAGSHLTYRMSQLLFLPFLLSSSSYLFFLSYLVFLISLLSIPCRNPFIYCLFLELLFMLKIHS